MAARDSSPQALNSVQVVKSTAQKLIKGDKTS